MPTPPVSPSPAPLPFDSKHESSLPDSLAPLPPSVTDKTGSAKAEPHKENVAAGKSVAHRLQGKDAPIPLEKRLDQIFTGLKTTMIGLISPTQETVRNSQPVYPHLPPSFFKPTKAILGPTRKASGAEEMEIKRISAKQSAVLATFQKSLGEAKTKCQKTRSVPEKRTIFDNWNKKDFPGLINEFTKLLVRLEKMPDCKESVDCLHQLRKSVATALKARTEFEEQYRPAKGRGSLHDLLHKWLPLDKEYRKEETAEKPEITTLIQLAQRKKTLLQKELPGAKERGWSCILNRYEQIHLRMLVPFTDSPDEEDYTFSLTLLPQQLMTLLVVLSNDLYGKTNLSAPRAKSSWMTSEDMQSNLEFATGINLPPPVFEEDIPWHTSISSEIKDIDQFVVDIHNAYNGIPEGQPYLTGAISDQCRSFSENLQLAADAYQEVMERLCLHGFQDSKLHPGLLSTYKELETRKLFCELYKTRIDIHLERKVPPAETPASAPDPTPPETAVQKTVQRSEEEVLAMTRPVIEEAMTRYQFGEKIGMRYQEVESRFREHQVIRGGVQQLNIALRQFGTVINAMEENNLERLGDWTKEDLEQKKQDCTSLIDLYETYLNSPKTRKRTEQEIFKLDDEREFDVSLPDEGKFLFTFNQNDRTIEIQVNHKDVTAENAPGRSMPVKRSFFHYHLDKSYRPDKKEFSLTDLLKIGPRNIAKLHEKDFFNREHGRQFERFIEQRAPGTYSTSEQKVERSDITDLQRGIRYMHRAAQQELARLGVPS